MEISDRTESGNQTRNITSNIRTKPTERDLIDHAAAVEDKRHSEFMIESAHQKAQNVLLDRRFFGLDELKFKQFVALIEASPTRNEKLQTLLATNAPWD